MKFRTFSLDLPPRRLTTPFYEEFSPRAQDAWPSHCPNSLQFLSHQHLFTISNLNWFLHTDQRLITKNPEQFSPTRLKCYPSDVVKRMCAEEFEGFTEPSMCLLHTVKPCHLHVFLVISTAVIKHNALRELSYRLAPGQRKTRAICAILSFGLTRIAFSSKYLNVMWLDPG